MRRPVYFEDEAERYGELRRIVAASEPLRDAMARADRCEEVRVRVLCPKRHFLRDLLLTTYHSDGLDLPLLEPVGASAEPVVIDATPAGRAKRVCDHSGCPRLMASTATVCEAGHVQAEDAAALRVRFTCRKCPYNDAKRQETLVKIYALALHIGSPELRLT